MTIGDECPIDNPWEKAMLNGMNRRVLIAACGALTSGMFAGAQAQPWVLYVDSDPLSGSICDVVNATNLELVVLEATGEFVSITGNDVAFVDTFVDGSGAVFFQGIPAGFIDFAEDGDGFRTLWLFTPFGDVANVDRFTGMPTPTGLLPLNFSDVPCDACPFWDEPDECLDSDFDGIENAFDLCPQTPLGELVDAFGCSCSQFDDDQDDVDNCVDLCPNTPSDLIAEADGCACEELDGDLDGINACLDLCPDTPLGELADIDGCSCSQLDDDLDDVSNCFDLCAGTPLTATVNIFGCPIDDTTDGGTVINLCGTFGAAIFGVMLLGLAGMRSGVRRHVF